MPNTHETKDILALFFASHLGRVGSFLTGVGEEVGVQRAGMVMAAHELVECYRWIKGRGVSDKLELGSWCYLGTALGSIGWGRFPHLQSGLVRGELAPCEHVPILIPGHFTVWGCDWPDDNGVKGEGPLPH